ncbi:MAG TPA: hypothetical protein VFK65_16200, partial [Candidatus Binatia bacterium]|nr:hypothetical protein [Candidatus Binatia bacterium]
MISIFSQFGGFAYFHLIHVAGENRDQFSFLSVNFIRQHMRIRNDMKSVADNKSRAPEDRRWTAGFLKCTNSNHSRFNFFDRIGERIAVGRMTCTCR